MGHKGQGAPAFHDALRVISGSGNPPDPLRWTLHLLWFAVLTRPGCPSLRPGAPRLFVSHCGTGTTWAFLCLDDEQSSVGHFLAAPSGSAVLDRWGGRAD